jgi:hypothetical protein
MVMGAIGARAAPVSSIGVDQEGPVHVGVGIGNKRERLRIMLTYKCSISSKGNLLMRRGIMKILMAKSLVYSFQKPHKLFWVLESEFEIPLNSAYLRGSRLCEWDRE